MSHLGRDRDPAGRARNARPRDALGRPLRHGAGAADGAVTAVPDDLALPAPAALDLTQQLLDEGRPFAAHEVLEMVWKAAPEPERELWRGLAQVCVGLTHVERGNAVGGARLLRRGAAHLGPFAATAPYGLDLRGVITFAAALADHPQRPPERPLRLRGAAPLG